MIIKYMRRLCVCASWRLPHGNVIVMMITMMMIIISVYIPNCEDIIRA